MDVAVGMEKLVDKLLTIVKQVLPTAKTVTGSGLMVAEAALLVAINVLIQRMENATVVLTAAGVGLLVPARATRRRLVNVPEAALAHLQAGKLQLRDTGIAINHFASPEGFHTLTNTGPLKCPMVEFLHMPPPQMSFFKVTQLVKNATSCNIMVSLLS